MFFYTVRLYSSFNYMLQKGAANLRSYRSLNPEFSRAYARVAKQAGVSASEAAATLVLLLETLELPEENQRRADKIIQVHVAYGGASMERMARLLDRAQILLRHGRLPSPFKTR